MHKIFDDMVKIGVDLEMKNGKKKVKLPIGWNKLTKSIYNNEENFAIITGKINDIIVIDLDNKDPDFIGLKWFEDNIGKLSNLNTFITKTVNNGFHIFFKYSADIQNTNNFNKLNIDILSNNKCCYQGYVQNNVCLATFSNFLFIHFNK